VQEHGSNHKHLPTTKPPTPIKATPRNTYKGSARDPRNRGTRCKKIETPKK